MNCHRKFSCRIVRVLVLVLGISVFPANAVYAQKSANPAPSVPAQLPAQIELLQPGVTLTMIAEHPGLVTPTGVDVDALGQIWLIACHTHFRPDGYSGPEHDEILVFNADGTNRRVFYNRTDATMHIKLGSDGWVYLAERDRILRVRDSNGDGTGDTEEDIAVLNTVADYPHNGLSGMAWHPDGALIFSLGENFGRDWTLKGRDESNVSGRGEGGVFRCSPDGKGLRRIAQGFWNPFGLLVRQDGEMFAAENDPGSRPPCRLLNVVEGGDYGFQWVYGSAPVHPFVAWNGELRGTLGMIHPSGEGPCAVVELGGGVMIPSWSNHCIDYFPLIRQGAGYTSKRIELLRGSDFFRPVCMAAVPVKALADDSLDRETFYLTDWVFSSYQLHSRGRLWKLEIDKANAPWLKPSPDPLNEDARLARDLREGRVTLDQPRLLELAQGSDAWLSDAALTALAKTSGSWTPESVRAMQAKDRVWALVALRRADIRDPKWVSALIADPDPEIRFECLRWIADGVLTAFLPNVEQMLSQPDQDFRLFEAALATWNTLNGNPGAGVTDPDVLIARITRDDIPPRLKGYALRLIPPSHAKISVELLRQLYSTGDPVLAREVVRTLAGRRSPDAQSVLSEIATTEQADEQLRADAVAGLAGTSDSSIQQVLLKLATDQNKTIRDEALRSLRSTTPDEHSRVALNEIAVKYPSAAPLVAAVLDGSSIHQGRPEFSDTMAWEKRLTSLPGEPDIEAGQRIFFHSRIAACSTCHRFQGRGNVVGPDLSLISQQGNPTSILKSILEPNRDVAPQFYSTVLELADGTIFSGILLRSSSTEVFRDAVGNERSFQKHEIVQRHEMLTSLMPSGQVAQLTDQELRDLLAFLTGAKAR